MALHVTTYVCICLSAKYEAPAGYVFIRDAENRVEKNIGKCAFLLQVVRTFNTTPISVCQI